MIIIKEKLLKERFNKFVEQEGIPMMLISRKTFLSPGSLYKWRKGERVLSTAAEMRIENYLKHFGY